MLYDSRKDTTIAAVMIRARALIADEKNFQQSGWGHNGRFCAGHAIFEAASAPNSSILRWDEIPAVCFLEKLCKSPLHFYNDRHTHAEVLALFDRGIVEAGKMEMY
jgi:hypothetical protein